VLIAPARKHISFALCSSVSPGNLLDGHHAKRPELTRQSCRLIFVRNSTPDELSIHPAGRVSKHCHSSGDTAANEVGRLEHPGAVGICRHDDNVRRLDWLVDK
jgi:hypothetical protein